MSEQWVELIRQSAYENPNGAIVQANRRPCGNGSDCPVARTARGPGICLGDN